MEYYDGFRSLEHDESSTYPSVLAPQGSVSWQHVDSEALASSFQAHGVSVKVSFPDVDWVLLQKVYGWAALQYQCWVRGYFEISSPSGAKTTIALHVSPAVDVWIDDEAFCGGDLYGYHKAPIILHLETGKHRIDARLAYDVRFMGGKITPDITLSVDMKLPADDQVLLPGDVLLSDAVDGVLVGNLVSVTVTNGASYTVRVTRIEDVDVSRTSTCDRNTKPYYTAESLRKLTFERILLNCSRTDEGHSIRFEEEINRR